MNRIQKAIHETNKRLETISAEKRSNIDSTLQEGFSSLARYQDAQAHAFASGKLTLDEAQTLYHIYGSECPDPERWAKQPLAARIVATQAAAELLKAELVMRRSYA